MPRGRPVKCPYCQSTKSVFKGYRRTAIMGLRRLKRCKSCGKRFTLKKATHSARKHA